MLKKLNAKKMKKAVWLRPEAVAQIEFLNGPRERSRGQTTCVRRTQPETFRITHPFHPLSGREFEALACKEYSGEQRVCFLDKKGRQCEIPLSWTDLAAEDPVTILASGKSWFRATDLVELACLVEGLQR